MRKIMFLIIVMLLVACKQDKETSLLQSRDIQLVKPKVMASNQIIDSVVIVTSELRVDDVKIYYTSDGSNPSQNSELYKEPLKLKKAGTYKFKAFHPEWKESEIETVEIIKKGKLVDSIIWLTKWNEKYIGKGIKTLVNNTKASVSYTNSQWLGFDTIAKAVCVFEKKAFIKSVDIGYLNNPGAWIFPPQKITVFVSADGESFKLKEELKIETLKEIVDQKIETIQLMINEEVKAIKIEIENVQNIPDWHEGSGKSAWLFMDEWVFN